MIPVLFEYVNERSVDDLPAAIVSPPRLRRMRPISLFTANGSIGMGLGTEPVPEKPSPRKVISISADVPLVKTLCGHVELGQRDVQRMVVPRIFFGYRTGGSIKTCNQLRNRRRHVSRVVKQLDLASRFPSATPFANMTGCTYRGTASDGKLDIENDYSCAETDRKRDKVIWRTEDAANIKMDRIDRSQIECCVGPRGGPRHAPFVEVDC